MHDHYSNQDGMNVESDNDGDSNVVNNSIDSFTFFPVHHAQGIVLPGKIVYVTFEARFIDSPTRPVNETKQMESESSSTVPTITIASCCSMITVWSGILFYSSSIVTTKISGIDANIITTTTSTKRKFTVTTTLSRTG
jgi:hypothetical protein